MMRFLLTAALAVALLTGSAEAEPGNEVGSRLSSSKARMAARNKGQEVRSRHKAQVARNVTAIQRGMRHAELERLAEVVLCEDGVEAMAYLLA